MKVQELFEKTISVNSHVDKLRSVLRRQLKPKLVGKNLTDEQAIEFIDGTLEKFGVQMAPKQEASQNASIDHNGVISLYYSENPAARLNDGDYFDEWLRTACRWIGHEMVHREQLSRQRAKTRVKEKEQDVSNAVKYLSEPAEIMAYAHQAVYELMWEYADAAKVLTMVKTTDRAALESYAFSMYKHYFKPEHPTWKRFIKYMVQYLE